MRTATAYRHHDLNGLARSLRALAAATVALTSIAVAPAVSQASDGAGTPILVELFTSQGCSTCPPADRHLGKLTKNDNIVALSFNVDYWDYLGWRDTLAKPEFTARQKAYAKARRDGQIYTPQLVVNGQAHASGAKTKAVAKLLAAANQTTANAPRISKQKKNGITHVSVGAGTATTTRRAMVWLATVRREVTTKIRRGENRGRNLVHHNVVRQIIPLGVWTGDATDYQLDMSMLMKDGAEACAIIIQEGEAGPVIASAWIHR